MYVISKVYFKFKMNEVRLSHFAISSANFNVPASPILFALFVLIKISSKFIFSD